MVPGAIACGWCAQAGAPNGVPGSGGPPRTPPRAWPAAVASALVLVLVIGGIAVAVTRVRDSRTETGATTSTTRPLTAAEKKVQAKQKAFLEAAGRQEARKQAFLGYCDKAVTGYHPGPAAPMPEQPAHVPGAPGQWILYRGDEMSLEPGSHPGRYGDFPHASQITLAVCVHPSEEIDSGKVCTYVPKNPDQYRGPGESKQRLFYTVDVSTVFELRTGRIVGETRAPTPFGIQCALESTMDEVQVSVGHGESTEGWVEEHLQGGRFR